MSNGIFLLYKEVGISSFQAIKNLQKKLNIKKVGHCGTLDPFACGLLIVMTNNATKLSDFLLNKSKTYKVQVQLYQATDTGDITGKPITPTYPITNWIPERKDIVDALNCFNQLSYLQTPPIFSAIKIAGRPAYSYARQGQVLELTPRWITVHKLKLTNYDKIAGTFSFTVACSKGTYIRSLVKDIGKKLKLPTVTKTLERTAIDAWKVEDAHSIDNIQAVNLINFPELISRIGLKLITIADQTLTQAEHGASISLPRCRSEIVVVSDTGGLFLALYRKSNKEHIYCCQRVLINKR